jgi:HAD superfamily hydrolase (TIGR01509 family)
VRRFDAVLFDNGETLFYRVDPIPSIVKLARTCGVTISEPSAGRVWAKVNRDNLGAFEHRLERNASREGHRRYYIGRYGPLEEIAPGLAELFYTHHKTSAETMVPYPDTRVVLGALRQHHIPLGIVSNTGWDISLGYAHAGLEHLIDAWVLSWQHGTAKPDPKLFVHACERLGVSPRRVLMVGNDAEADGGASAVGATVLILPPVDPGQHRGLGAVLDLLDIPAEADDEPTLAAAPTLSL